MFAAVAVVQVAIASLAHHVKNDLPHMICHLPRAYLLQANTATVSIRDASLDTPTHHTLTPKDSRKSK